MLLGPFSGDLAKTVAAYAGLEDIGVLQVSNTVEPPASDHPSVVSGLGGHTWEVVAYGKIHYNSTDKGTSRYFG